MGVLEEVTSIETKGKKVERQTLDGRLENRPVPCQLVLSPIPFRTVELHVQDTVRRGHPLP